MFKQVNVRNLAIAGFNLLALGSSAFAQNPAYEMPLGTSDRPSDSTDASTINLASLKSIEGTWIQVKPICKSRHFNADPMSTPVEKHGEDVLAVFSSFNQVVA